MKAIALLLINAIALLLINNDIAASFTALLISFLSLTKGLPDKKYPKFSCRLGF